MSDVYGNLVFTKSKDCVLDLQKIADVLNQYSWTHMNTANKWLVNGNPEYLIFDESDVYQPIAEPALVIHQVEDPENSEVKSVPHHLMTEEDFENEIDVEDLDLDPKTVAVQVSAHISEGWIEISSVCADGRHMVAARRFRINADGTGYMKAFCSSSGEDAYEEDSSF